MIKTEDYTRELMTIFFSQKKIIIYSTVFLGLWALAIALFWPPTFAAEGTLLIKGTQRVKSPEALEVSQSPTSLIAETSKEDLTSEMKVLLAFDVLKNTLVRLKEQNLLPSNVSLQDEVELQRAVDRMQKAIQVEVIPVSNVIEVRYMHRDPRFAVTALKILFEEYLRYRFALYNPSETESFYKQQASRFSQGISELEDRLVAVSRKAGSTRPDLEIENNLMIKKELEQQLVRLRGAAVEKRLLIQDIERALTSSDLQLFSYLDVPSINALAEKVEAMMVARANLLSLYTTESQKIQNSEAEIDTATKALRDEVSSYRHNQGSILQGLEAQIVELEGRLNVIAGGNLALSDHQVEIDRIRRELELQNQSYNVFTKRWEEARMNASPEANSLFAINVLSRPAVSDTPVFPKRGILVPLGLLAGFITGCCLGFVREYFDHSFKKPEDVNKYTNLPTIISIPKWESLEG